MAPALPLVAWACMLPAAASAAITATTAADICPVTADPCVVTTRVDLTGNATLDFGTRTVTVSGGGQFNTGTYDVKIKCGNFTASPSGAGVAINATGAGALPGTTDGGIVEIDALKRCSQGSRTCLRESDCQLGSCSVRRCSLRPSRTCKSDDDCNIGTCVLRRCSLNNLVRCTSDAQCSFGTCPAQLTCEGSATEPVACSSDAGCQFGSCSIGSGSIDMGGAIAGASDLPAIVTLRAADAIAIRKDVNLKSTNVAGDGGQLEVDCASGDVAVVAPAKIDVSGGADASGGSLSVYAGGSVTLGGEIDCTGGDSDGGSVDVVAGVDVVVRRDINCNSDAGGGYGGEITFEAGRDLTVNGVSASNRTDFLTQGHTDGQGFAGDGGVQELSAGRDLSLNAYTTYQLSGSSPDGEGAEMSVDAGGDVTLAGLIESKSQGTAGAGGYVGVSADGKVQVPASGSIDVTGGSAGGGAVDLFAGGALTLAGTVDAGAGSQGPGGSVSISGDGDLSLSGELTTKGGPGAAGDGQLAIEACRISLAFGSTLDNRADRGGNQLTARESMKLLAGSKVLSDSGSNELTYRTADKPPLLAGTITPSPLLTLDPTLVGCPVCGNGELDQGETCEDGNTRAGDGCSADCQNENCIAQTPGYPDVPLCDDGSECTLDTCNTAVGGGVCEHEMNCGDAIACTVDSCVEGACVNLPVDGACEDGNPCTDDACSVLTGCFHLDNTAPCDDASPCTQDDRCSAGVCRGDPVDCSDGVDCTDDVCDEPTGTCTHLPDDALCANGVFCDGAETCDAASGCQPAAPVDCSSLDGFCAAGVCYEAAGACVTLAIRQGAPCDDDDPCTSEDICRDGVCAGTDVPGCRCGNGVVDSGEQCDDGDTVFVEGEACDAQCQLVPCGRPTGWPGALPLATDALFALRAAVQTETCSLQVCDADGDLAITAADALLILRQAVGLPVELNCPE